MQLSPTKIIPLSEDVVMFHLQITVSISSVVRKLNTFSELART